MGTPFFYSSLNKIKLKNILIFFSKERNNIFNYIKKN